MGGQRRDWQPPVLAEHRVRRDDACPLTHDPPAEVLASHCQPTALGVGQAKRSRTKVLSEDAILFPEKVDTIFLVAIHPASQGQYEEVQSVGCGLKLRGSDTAVVHPVSGIHSPRPFLAPYGDGGPRRSNILAMTVLAVFKKSVEAIRAGKLIERESTNDKEFHFQNWCRKRFDETGEPVEAGGRNSYPDFRMVKQTDGYEIKGLAYPGRNANFDSNSQIPTGHHNGRTIYYVFGRYPKNPDGNKYQVVDLVMCHGDFLNADHDYVHKNKNVKGFGTYGDIMIRDRKMYVVPTPFHLVEGLADRHTLILPSDARIPSEAGLVAIGDLCRKEAAELIVGYSFNLKTNALVPIKAPNPHLGKEHLFRAWRVRRTPGTSECVAMRSIDVTQIDFGTPAEEE